MAAALHQLGQHLIGELLAQGGASAQVPDPPSDQVGDRLIELSRTSRCVARKAGLFGS